jgi:quercetin dioxygenase-like cupin family protein
MRIFFLLAASAMLAQAQSATVAPLMTKEIPEFEGKEVIMITVSYAPGQASTAHRHHAHVFIYVLEGSVVMGVAGGETKTLGPGDTFYENPKDIHVVSKNASDTKPAKMLVMMLKDKGKPVSEPVNRK